MYVISHRGNVSKYNENSFNGIKSAFSLLNIDGVEFDVRVTKDKKFVLIHDYFIDKVSSGSGIVKNMKLKELYKYDFKGEKVSLLKDVLNIDTDKIFMIELKFSDKEYFKIKRKLISLLKKYSYKNLYVCSFNNTIIEDLMKYNLNIKLGLIRTKNIKKGNYDFYLINKIFFNEELFKKINDKELFIWTLKNKNDINNMWKYKNKSNFGVITDYINKEKV